MFSVAAAGVGFLYIVFVFLCIAALAIVTASMWKIFKKAGYPGWASLIPFYSMWVLIKLSCKNNILWFILFLIPASSAIACVITYVGLNKCFNKGIGNLLLLIFIPAIGFPMLALGSSEYDPDNKF